MARPRIFTTHRHAYSGDFWRLADNMRYYFDYDDLSVHDQKFDGRVPPRYLEATIVNRIYQCNLFIAVGRRATSFGGWCTWEIERARDMWKPILCYSPYGMDPSDAPAVARNARSYLGHFTQIRRLVTLMDQLGLDV